MKHLTQEDANKLKDELTRPVHKHAAHSFAVVLDENKFNRIMAGYVIVREGERFRTAAYSVGCLAVFINIRKWTEETKFSGTISYTFEAGHKDEPVTNRLLNREFSESQHKHAKYYYSGHEFKRKNYTKLQAADLIVWNTAKMYVDRERGREPSTDFVALFEGRDGDMIYRYHEKHLEELRDMLIGANLLVRTSPP